MSPLVSRLLHFIAFFLTVLTCLQHASVNGVADATETCGSVWCTGVWALYIVSLISLFSWWSLKSSQLAVASVLLSSLFLAFLAATSPLPFTTQLPYVVRACVLLNFGSMPRQRTDKVTVEPRREIDDVKIAVEVPLEPTADRMTGLISDLQTRPTRKSTYRGFCIDPQAIAAPSSPCCAFPSPAAMSSLTERHLPYVVRDQEAVREILRSANGWDFPIFRFVEATHNHPLLVLSLHLFEQEGFFERFGIDVEKFVRFLNVVENSYRSDITYHNRVHATDVLQTSNAILHLSGLRKYLTDLDVLAIFFGAIIHDIGHPGVKADFLIKVGATEALMFNGRNLLENYHLALAFSILDRPENNFLENLRREDFIYLHHVVVDMVLATDLAGHDEFIEKWRKRFQPVNGEKVTLSASTLPKPEDRITLMQMVVKLADVSTPTKELSLFMRWSKNCLEEFVLQAELEKELGLPFAWFMDKDQMKVPSEQISFIKRFVMPLWETFDALVPIPGPMATLRNSLTFWEHRKSLGERVGLREEDFQL